jgi:hypothetical protein
MMACFNNGLGPTPFALMIKELHFINHNSKHLQYLQILESWLACQRKCWAFDKSELKRFSKIDDKYLYYGRPPSSNFLITIFNRRFKFLVPLIEKEIQKGTGEILKMDHSFKVIKTIGKLNGVSSFNAIFTVTNEYEEIRCMVLTPTKGHEFIKLPLKELCEGLKNIITNSLK